MFTMGRQAGSDNPLHQVNLPDFWIYRTKVTQGQYAYCVASGNCTLPDKLDNPSFSDPARLNDPVVGVNYAQAGAYCSFVHARLPTEAEWEKTARGPEANLYPWGAGEPSCDRLNFETCLGKTSPVNTYPAGMSYYQAFDMEGNAFEWVSDWYKPDYFLNSPPDSPLGPDSGQVRSVRSSAFNSGANQTQAYDRFFSSPIEHRSNLGFRCVVLDPAYFAQFCQYPPTYGTNGVGGASTGGNTKVDCPNLSIQQSPACVGTTSLTIVTFGGPGNPDVPTGCSQTNNPGQYHCTQDGTLTICSSCTVTTTSPPQCPPAYDVDPLPKP